MKAKYTLKEMKDIAKERGGECLSLRYEHQSHTLTSYFFFISILNIRKTTFFMKERNILIMQNFLQSDGKQVVTDSGEICTLSVVKDSDKLTVIATDRDGHKFKPHIDADLMSSLLRFYGTEVLSTFAIDLNSQEIIRPSRD